MFKFIETSVRYTAILQEKKICEYIKVSLGSPSHKYLCIIHCAGYEFCPTSRGGWPLQEHSSAVWGTVPLLHRLSWRRCQDAWDTLIVARYTKILYIHMCELDSTHECVHIHEYVCNAETLNLQLALSCSVSLKNQHLHWPVSPIKLKIWHCSSRDYREYHIMNTKLSYKFWIGSPWKTMFSSRNLLLVGCWSMHSMPRKTGYAHGLRAENNEKCWLTDFRTQNLVLHGESTKFCGYHNCTSYKLFCPL